MLIETMHRGENADMVAKSARKGLHDEMHASWATPIVNYLQQTIEITGSSVANTFLVGLAWLPSIQYFVVMSIARVVHSLHLWSLPSRVIDLLLPDRSIAILYIYK